MWEWLPELLGSAATGGVLGVVGNVVKSVFHGREETRANRQALELAKISADAQVQIARTTQSQLANAQIEQARMQVEFAQAQNQQMESRVKLAAVEAEGGLNQAGDGFADSVRKLIRPILTTYLIVYISLLPLWLESASLIEYVVMQLVTLAVASGFFWFGGRPKAVK